MKKIAFIGTGGTLSSLGANSLDLVDYEAQGTFVDAAETLRAVPEVLEVAEVFPVAFSSVASRAVYFREWKALVETCHKLRLDDPDLQGIVIGHGTAVLEETAYFLNLTLKTDIPVVVVGAQRPLNGLSTDAKLNLVNAVKVASADESRGRGVLVVMNDEIHAARDVTKSSTFRLNAFQTADFGILGNLDGARVNYYRRPERVSAPYTEFDISAVDELHRVDIVHSYAGADGVGVSAFVAGGAKGIVCAGFAPGSAPEAQVQALMEASSSGIPIVQTVRAGSGVVKDASALRKRGFISGDNLTPQKARILLALALTHTTDRAEITQIFKTY